MHSTRFQRLHRRFGAALMPSRIAFPFPAITFQISFLCSWL